MYIYVFGILWLCLFINIGNIIVYVMCYLIMLVWCVIGLIIFKDK